MGTLNHEATPAITHLYQSHFNPLSAKVYGDDSCITLPTQRAAHRQNRHQGGQPLHHHKPSIRRARNDFKPQLISFDSFKFCGLHATCDVVVSKLDWPLRVKGQEVNGNHSRYGYSCSETPTASMEYLVLIKFA